MQREELERIYDEHALCACSLFRRFSDCEADVHDLLQDWLIQIARRVKANSQWDSERAYVLRIAYRLAVDWKRRGDTRSRYHTEAAIESETQGTLPDDGDEKRFREEVERSITQLPVEQQLVVQMKLWDELTFAEIAEVLKVSANTVASRYRYGIAKLKEALQPWYKEMCC